MMTTSILYIDLLEKELLQVARNRDIFVKFPRGAFEILDLLKIVDLSLSMPHGSEVQGRGAFHNVWLSLPYR